MLHNLDWRIVVGTSIWATTAAAIVAPLIDQRSTSPQNILRYMGSDGPYVASPGYGLDTCWAGGPCPAAPDCAVDQVQMLMRHGERYPKKGMMREFEDTLVRIKLSSPQGALKFVEHYQLFMNVTLAGKETSSGMYSGLDDAYFLGIKMFDRYRGVWDNTTDVNELIEGNARVNFYTSSSKRVYDTASNFAQGFLEGFVNGTANIVVMSENAQFGANSLTPYKSCPPFLKTQSAGEPNFEKSFWAPFATKVIERLKLETPSLMIGTDDVKNLFRLCSFELNAVGDSEFCSIFETSEWAQYGHYRNIVDFYTVGPGNPASAAVGSVYTKAALDVLKRDDSDPKNRLFFSFSHHPMIQSFLSSLGIFDISDHELDVSKDGIPVSNPWQVSNLCPMGAHVAIERHSCPSGKYVRLVVNDAILPIPHCQSGPGSTCPVGTFTGRLQGIVHDFEEVCDLEESKVPKQLSVYSTTQPTTEMLEADWSDDSVLQ